MNAESITTQKFEELRNRLLEEVEDLDSLLKALLELASREIMIASEHIDCPYCKRHMELEAGELERVLKRITGEGNTSHKHGIRERLVTLATSLKIFYYVVLGGLRRAGII